MPAIVTSTACFNFVVVGQVRSGTAALAGSLAGLELRTEQVVPAGDHDVAVHRPRDVDARPGGGNSTNPRFAMRNSSSISVSRGP